MKLKNLNKHNRTVKVISAILCCAIGLSFLPSARKKVLADAGSFADLKSQLQDTKTSTVTVSSPIDYTLTSSDINSGVAITLGSSKTLVLESDVHIKDTTGSLKNFISIPENTLTVSGSGSLTVEFNGSDGEHAVLYIPQGTKTGSKYYNGSLSVGGTVTISGSGNYGRAIYVMYGYDSTHQTNLTISGGTFTGSSTVGDIDAVYANNKSGTSSVYRNMVIRISGGTFSASTTTGTARGFHIGTTYNNNTTSTTNSGAHVAISGGTFYGIKNDSDYNAQITKALTANSSFVRDDGTFITDDMFDTPDMVKAYVAYEIKYLTSTDGRNEVTYDTRRIERGEKAINLVPVEEGYKFTGWYATRDENYKWDGGLSGHYEYSNYKNSIDFDTAPTSNLTIYGYFTTVDDRYTVTYNTGILDSSLVTGMPSKQSNIKYNGKATAPTVTPSANGYVFTGWYADSDCKNEFDFNTPITANTTVYAGWESVKNEFTITFAQNCPEEWTTINIPTPYTLARGEKIERPADPIRTREDDFYVFVLWSEDHLFTTDEGYNFDTPVDHDTTLYAKWVNKGTWVKFNIGSNGPTDVDNIPDNYKVLEYSKITAPATTPSATGWTFDGWYTDSACTTGNEFVFGETPVGKAGSYSNLYAKFTKNEYTVDFNMGGHGTAPENQTIAHGSKATKPADPSAEGYRFDGWYTSASCDTEFSFDTAITKPTTVYAKWTELFTVTFDANGHGTAPENQTIAHGSKATKPADPSAEGYRFDGWYTTAAGNTEFDFTKATITSDTTIYAHWTELFTVTYDANGHGTAPTPATVANGETASKPTDPSETGWTFAGWYTDAACAEADKFEFTTAITGDITLYAKWTPATNTAYVVEHYQQDVTGDGYTKVDADTENLTGTTGETATFTSKTYTGFTYDHAEPADATIAADGS
ncbi:MAG: InlB B-repeat-containing protein, partial [Prevotellaceae bacterium]|nr:InlB B-repeat-containing protein [Candidatus Faecinaster equi]